MRREGIKKMSEDQQKIFDGALAGFLKQGLGVQDAYNQTMRAYPELFNQRDLRCLKIHDQLNRAEVRLEKFVETTPHEVSKPERLLTFEETIIHDWKADPKLQKEFKTFLTYYYYRKAEKAGNVKIIGGAK